MAKFVDLTGKRFGRLTVIRRDNRPSDPRGANWLCQCDCGEWSYVFSDTLNSAHSQSCGCLRRERAAEAARLAHTTHGMTNTNPLYRLWGSIRSRCHNPKAVGYDRYGGRGITFCTEWDDFPTFVRDVGPRPSKHHSLDRIDVNGHYERGNVRWATNIEQQNNRRDNVRVVYRGKDMSIRDAWRLAGCVVAISSVRRRIANGWDLDHALEIPHVPYSAGRAERLAYALSKLWEAYQDAAELEDKDLSIIREMIEIIKPPSGPSSH